MFKVHTRRYEGFKSRERVPVSLTLGNTLSFAESAHMVSRCSYSSSRIDITTFGSISSSDSTSTAGKCRAIRDVYRIRNVAFTEQNRGRRNLSARACSAPVVLRVLGC